MAGTIDSRQWEGDLPLPPGTEDRSDNSGRQRTDPKAGEVRDPGRETAGMRRKTKRLIAWILTVVTAVAFMPMAGGVVFAADGDYTYDEETVYLSAKEIKAEQKKAEAKAEEKLGIVDDDGLELGVPMDGIDTKGAEAGAPAEAGGAKAGSAEFEAAEAETAKETKGVQQTDLKANPIQEGTIKEADGTIIKSLGSQDDTGYIQATDPDEYGYVQVTGADLNSILPGYAYVAIGVGNELGDMDSIDWDNLIELSGWSHFSQTLDMKKYEVGYHSIWVFLSNGENYLYSEVPKVPTLIYGKPSSNKLKNYYTGIKYFTYQYQCSNYYKAGPGEYLDVCMQYKKSGGSWNTTVYPMQNSYTSYKKGGLKPNTAYNVRLMFGKEFEYGGETYLFAGAQTGYTTSAKTIKTAYKKPKVKSIKATNVRTKVYKYRYRTGTRYTWRVNRRTGQRWLIRTQPVYRTYRYYYTKYKINVKFKKKQGVAGVCIRTIHGLYAWKKGDKKTYSQTFTVRGKKKGKKVTVKVQSYRSKIYGGYSGKYKKKVRL